MKENPEVKSKALEAYKNINKVTLAGALGVAVFVPALTVPALGLAAFDAAQIYGINKINKKENGSQGKGETVFTKVKDLFVAKGNPRVRTA